ncbi:MAG: S9 family peptidase [Clostridia bacterium]|nr:S9 family peptidase [Clostridia bacterium]
MMKGKGRNFSIEEMISLSSISESAINYDGSKVVYEVTSTDWHENQFVKELWLYDTKDKRHFLLVGKSEAYVGSPKWSPDGKRIAFILNVKDKKEAHHQLFICEVESRENYQVSHHEKGLEKYVWSSDSKGFYCTAKSLDSKIKEDRDLQYGKFTYIDEDRVNSNLFYLDLELGLSISKSRYQLPKDLVKKSKKDKDNKFYPAVLLNKEQKFYIHQMTISPDNKKLALVTAPSPTMEDYDDIGLYLYEIESKNWESITIDDFAGNVHFSPDSSQLCMSIQDSWLKNNQLALYDLKNGKLRKVPLSIDEVVYVTQWIDKGIIFSHLDKTSSKYYLLDEHFELKVILEENGVYYHNVHFSHNGENFIHLERNEKTLLELYVNKNRVSNQSLVLKGRELPEKKMIQWMNKDGYEIEGVLSLPKDYDEEKRYPLLVIIHGGPTGISFPFPLGNRLYPIETFVEKGFIILEPNYRGSAGYGEKFRSSNYKNLGVGDYEDVISGVDYLINQGYANKDQVGVMGWSQGGYISAYCTTFSDRFKAISVGAGISNWETYYFNTDIPKFTKEYLGDVPFRDKAIYEKTSPMTHINKAKTPTLIQHGSADQRVPVANAHELYRALKELKLEPKMVIYENMDHGPSTPGLIRAINRQNLNWFCHHLLGEPLEAYYLKKEK